MVFMLLKRDQILVDEDPSCFRRGRFEVRHMREEKVKLILSGFPTRLRRIETARFEADPDWWLREKGLPPFGYNLYHYPDMLTSQHLGNFKSRDEAIDYLYTQI